MSTPKIIPPRVPKYLRAKFYPVSAAEAKARSVATVFADIDRASLQQLSNDCQFYWRGEIARCDAVVRSYANEICAEVAADCSKMKNRQLYAARHADKLMASTSFLRQIRGENLLHKVNKICQVTERNMIAAHAAIDELLAMRWHPTREWLPPEDAWFFLIRFVGKGEKGAARNSLVCCFIDNLFRRERARAFLERVEQRLSAANYKK